MGEGGVRTDGWKNQRVNKALSWFVAHHSSQIAKYTHTPMSIYCIVLYYYGMAGHRRPEGYCRNRSMLFRPL